VVGTLEQLVVMIFYYLKTKKPFFKWFFVVLLFIFFGACGSSRSVENRIIHADSIIVSSQLTPLSIKTPYFALQTAYNFSEPMSLLTVYIEGDGRSWVSRNQLSSNPTPINPLALHLAAIHAQQQASASVAWIARPCQYQPTKGDINCESKYWSSHRFDEKVIESTNVAIDQLMQKSGATNVRLIGFSGGAAVAILAAVERDDVESIVSIAGNLDHRQVNEFHGVTPLRGSLNPKDVATQLASIPQVHFVGASDKVIPSVVVDDFIKVQANNCAQKVVVINAGHIDGWIDYWPTGVSGLDDRLSCSKYELPISF